MSVLTLMQCRRMILDDENELADILEDILATHKTYRQVDQWIINEMKGYDNESPIPFDRIVDSEIKFDDNGLYAVINSIKPILFPYSIKNPILEIERLLIEQNYVEIMFPEPACEFRDTGRKMYNYVERRKVSIIYDKFRDRLLRDIVNIQLDERGNMTGNNNTTYNIEIASLSGGQNIFGNGSNLNYGNIDQRQSDTENLRVLADAIAKSIKDHNALLSQDDRQMLAGVLSLIAQNKDNSKPAASSLKSVIKIAASAGIPALIKVVKDYAFHIKHEGYEEIGSISV